MITMEALQEKVRASAERGQRLLIQGNASRQFLGRTVQGEPLSLSGYRGIIDYSPAELVLSARAGTLLSEVGQTLAAEGQMLAFEPPALTASATLGGTIACGLSGPRRPWTGAARDFVLGINCINGRGEFLRLGGQVMKNVAGYDLSRTLTGSLGTLAVIIDIHLKVLPRPETERTLAQDCTAAEAIERCNRWSGRPVPLSAACHAGGRLLLRLSGTEQGVAAAAKELGGDALDDGNTFWDDLREQRLPFFAGEAPLWRLSLPPASKPLLPEEAQLIDWGGAQRWLRTDLPAAEIRRTLAGTGGHATLFRHGDRSGEVFHPLPAALLNLHRRLKDAFDPRGIFSPGRLYEGL